MPDTSAENNAEIIRLLTDRLQGEGISISKTPDGKGLFLLTSQYLGMNSAGVLVAIDGGGCFFWDFQRELNVFRLISAGFRSDLASTLAAALNAVYLETSLRGEHESPNGRKVTPQ